MHHSTRVSYPNSPSMRAAARTEIGRATGELRAALLRGGADAIHPEALVLLCEAWAEYLRAEDDAERASAEASERPAGLPVDLLLPSGTCRHCACTETDACETPAGPCRWVEPDLCSACAAPGLLAAKLRHVAHEMLVTSGGQDPQGFVEALGLLHSVKAELEAWAVLFEARGRP
jgi:hypothetical protein